MLKEREKLENYVLKQYVKNSNKLITKELANMDEKRFLLNKTNKN